MGNNLPYVNLGTDRQGKRLGAQDIDVGMWHTCVLTTDNTVKCWGEGYAGQLGTGLAESVGDKTGTMGDNMKTVMLGAPAKRIAVNGNMSCAILDDGRDSLKCWGRNTAGQLGQGDTNYRGDQVGEMEALLPIDLGGLGAVNMGISDDDTATSSPEDHICAILTDGSVRCWGMNAYGQCGTGDSVQRGDAAGEMGSSLPLVNLGSGCPVK